MRIETNDEAARLRLNVKAIKSSEALSASAAVKTDDRPSNDECLDCREHIVECRCSPGEG